MIILKTLRWSNCFSYGKNNEIDFTASPITQLVGANGHGKSSIALILELVLFNKNSKGTKAGKIVNRYVKETYYTIDLTFSKDDEEYSISTKRASSQAISLTKNGCDISAHTATGTFKLIEEILGFDHKTFCQLVYQSSAQSLEFLTATDTARKKFLIDLLSLEKYSETFEIFKGIAKAVEKEVEKAENTVKVISSWLDKHNKIDLTPKEVTLPEPSRPVDLCLSVTKLNAELASIESINRSIVNNNKYKEILDSIDLNTLPTTGTFQDTSSVTKEKIEWEKTLQDSTMFINKVKALKSNCPTCAHPLDHSKQLELVDSTKETIIKAGDKVRLLSEKLFEIKKSNKLIEDNASAIARWEQHHSLFNPKLGTEILMKDDLKARVISLEIEIEKQERQISVIAEANAKALVHNSKVSVIAEQLAGMAFDLAIGRTELEEATKSMAVIQVLLKAFSTNGLVAYKIEAMVKDLEELVNLYLGDLSDGRFQLGFVISAEKLNVVITDNGNDIEMLELSAGERARVNTATLLAIRKLMQQLSNTKVNLLILDETIDSLDAEGKEKLVELLIKEEHLNTFLVSHGYNHPLLEKLHVIKEDNISRIE